LPCTLATKLQRWPKRHRNGSGTGNVAGRCEISAAIAFRVAKALSGKALPPGVCKHCGRSNDT
jgi:hypothetical protein